MSPPPPEPHLGSAVAPPTAGGEPDPGEPTVGDTDGTAPSPLPKRTPREGGRRGRRTGGRRGDGRARRRPGADVVRPQELDGFDESGDDLDALAPPVVAVMVAHDPGPWWEDSLASLARQTYGNLSVLVIATPETDADGPVERAGTGAIAASDVAAGTEAATATGTEVATATGTGAAGLEARLRGCLPDAVLHRLDRDRGYGPSSNDVIGSVEGAAFYLFCHDDVVLDERAVQTMVQEAFRSNAGIVGPKVVAWDDPHRLVQVGMGADKFGAPSPLAERGEYDQEQHDSVRDVFYVPGGAMLVRADLFATLGGFDPDIELLGEDLDLCWRAHVVGARVLVAPDAVVAHRESLDDRRQAEDRRRLVLRHRLRTVMVCYRPWHRWRVLVQALVLSVVEAITSLVLGRVRHAGDVATSWTSNLRALPSIRRQRKALDAVRIVPDREVRRLQVRGSARVSTLVRHRLGANDDRLTNMAGAGRELADSLRASSVRVSIVVWLLIGVVLLLGSRDLIAGGVPDIGELAPIGSGPLDLVRSWASGYSPTGLGAAAPNPTGTALLGLAGIVFLGSMGVLRVVLILGLLPLGLLGMWRLGRPIGSRRSRVVALIVYVAMPVAVNSLSVGRWSGLVAYALAPWIVNQLARASKLAPFGPEGGEPGPGVVDRPLAQRILLLGVITALGAALVPMLVPLVLAVAIAMAVGGLLVGQLRGAGRMVAVAVGAAVVAALLHLPWTISFVSADWAAVARVAGLAPPEIDLSHILRFATGPVGVSPLAWAFLVAAALAVLVGRRWRLAWAVRGWTLALAGWALVWVASHDWLPGTLPAPEVLLAPGAVGLALASAMGMAAFEVDLPDYHFGWRQIASVVAGGALVVCLVPVLQVSADGAWNMPRKDMSEYVANLPSPSGNFRTLWIGDASVVPLTGWPLDSAALAESGPGHQLVYGTTRGRTPESRDLWPGTDDGATSDLGRALLALGDGQTQRLGSRLAPMAIEYIVVPRRLAPPPYVETDTSRPEALLDALAVQLDLSRVDFLEGLTVYRNDAWGPTTARLAPDVALPTTGSGPAAVVPELAGAPDALPDVSAGGAASGDLPGPATVYVAAGGGDQWSLTVDGADAPRTDAVGWASAFRVDRSGPGALSFATSGSRVGLLVVQVVLWVVALALLWRTRMRKESELDRAHVREDHEL